MSCTTNTCGTGGWGGPLPGDPDTSNSILTATPAFGGIDVAWTYPELLPHAVAHTLLYRGVIPDFNGAILHRIVSGNFYYDKVDAAIRYYYWIRMVSVNGTVGELIGPASALARPTIEQTIEQLTGMIDAGLLAQSLKADLDKISLLNTNLLNEITARENGETTLAEAMADVEAGVAEALTFIQTEINSRSTADSAIAEQLNVVAATLGDDLAAVTTAMQVDIDAVQGTVDAMYTAKVTVNGLVGGFGIHNNGDSVEAGFDVDTFWVGRTSANKRKPFIISGQETFIDEAVINKLTFSKLRDEAGSFVVEDGKIKAQYMAVNYLSALSANMGQVTISGQNGDWGYIRSPNKWLDNNWGYIFAQHPGGSMFFDLNLNGFRLYAHHDAGVSANWGLVAPGISMGPGGLTVSQLNVIGTAQIQGNAVTVPGYAESGIVGNQTVTLVGPLQWQLAAVGGFNSVESPIYINCTFDLICPPAEHVNVEIRLYRDGAHVATRTVSGHQGKGATNFWIGAWGAPATYRMDVMAHYHTFNGGAAPNIYVGLLTMFMLACRR